LTVSLKQITTLNFLTSSKKVKDTNLAHFFKETTKVKTFFRLKTLIRLLRRLFPVGTGGGPGTQGNGPKYEISLKLY
jgi:hypothetical protein